MVSSEETQDASVDDDSWDFPILNQFSRLIAGAFFPIFQFNTERLESHPSEIEIGYGEKIKLDVGLIDMLEENTSDFTKIKKVQPFLTARYLDFSVEFPDFSSDGWLVSFNPTQIYFEVGKVMKTNVTIQLNNPRVPVQSGRIRIKVTDYWVFSNVWFPEGPEKNILQKFSWFFGAITAGFGKYSGQVLPEEFYFDLLVNVKPFRDAQLEALDLVKLKPNSITSIPITIKNRGNYNDTFAFRITSEYKNIKLTDPTIVSLQPGQSADTLLGVAVPDYVVDTGTVYSINIEVYSIEEPNVTIASQKVILETQGYYVSEMNGVFFGLMIILFIGIIVITVRKIKKMPKKKAEEKKKTVTKKKKEKKKPKGFFSNLFKESKEKPRKEEIKTEPVKKEEKPVEIKKEEPSFVKKVDRKAEEERRKKEKAIEKIKKQQEKQKSKLL